MHYRTSVIAGVAACLASTTLALPFAGSLENFERLFFRRATNDCVSTFQGRFQITIVKPGAVQNQPAANGQKQSVKQISDNQAQAVSQISDNQPQAKLQPISQIADNQPQAATAAAPAGTPISQIADNQPQAATAPPPPLAGTPISQISDNQPQAATAGSPAGVPISQIADYQPQAATTGPPISRLANNQPQIMAAALSSAAPVACNPNLLTGSLKNGVLTDSKGNIAYIASNTQFQYDNPVQAGGTHSNDWTLCGNNTLASAGNCNFYTCETGQNFFNIYNDGNYNPGKCTLVNLVISVCA